ncbi:hypothetical protein JCM10212_002847 [Sporobolomyces blumeae]
MERKHVCILPDSVPLESSDPNAAAGPSRFLRLPHPRTLEPALFLPYIREGSTAPACDGLLEVQRLAQDADKQRSWFLEEEVVSDGNVSIFAPFDPIFLVLSYLSVLPSRFVSYSDLWETISQHRFVPPSRKGQKGQENWDEDEFEYEDDLLRLSRMECVKERLEKVCETQEYESDTLYRLSPSLVLDALKSKIDLLTSPTDGLFGPLESTDPGEKAASKAEEGSPATTSGGEADSKAFSTVSRGLGKEGVGNGQGLSERLQTECRQKYAIGVLSNYLAPASAHTLLSAHEFPELKAFLGNGNSISSSYLGTTYLPGRGSTKIEGEGSLGGGAAAALAKKRKAETKGSRGVEALKKVNTKGMKSLAEMFGKQTAAAAGAKGKAAATSAAKAKGKKK